MSNVPEVGQNAKQNNLDKVTIDCCIFTTTNTKRLILGVLRRLPKETRKSVFADLNYWLFRPQDLG